jgi:hypothetical protein
LNELELRAGLTCSQLSEIERQAIYLLALKKHVAANPDSMFAQSFNVDDFGVAAELLRWRDELVKAGWVPEVTGISKKLDTLAFIEKEFDCIGESDRWTRIAARTEAGNILPAGWEVEVQIRKDLLQPIFSAIFDNLERQKVILSYVETPPCATARTNLRKIQEGLTAQDREMGITSPDDTLRIIKFKHLCDAYEWAAEQDYDTKNTVVANEYGKVFNNILFSHGKARSGSVIPNSNPQVVQLFKLGLSLFIKPLNVYNLLSYLQVQINPLPSDLRFQLIDILIGTGGLGKEWDNAIANYEFKDADGNIDKAKKEKRLVFINMVSAANDGYVKIVDLNKYVSAMHAWSTGRLNLASLMNTGLREQLSGINTFCETLLILVNNTSAETIPYEQLKSWILSIYRPFNYTHEEAQQSSVIAVESPASIVDTPRQLLWMDCYGRNAENYPLDFLNILKSNICEEMVFCSGIKIYKTDLRCGPLKILSVRCPEVWTL